MRVVPLEQIDLPIALPLLELFFAAQRRGRSIVRLKPNQPLDLVSFRKAGDELVFVLPNPPRELRSRADIKRSVRFAGEEIDVEH